MKKHKHLGKKPTKETCGCNLPIACPLNWELVRDHYRSVILETIEELQLFRHVDKS